MKQGKILFPTDFSALSLSALRQAVELNKALGYEWIILHVYHRPYAEQGYDQQRELKMKEEKIDKQFEQLLEDMPELKKQKYQMIKKLGYSVTAIAETALHADVVMMSTKGAVGIGELFGTTTAKIIKTVQKPVIVIPKNASLHDLKRIGLACDYSEKAYINSMNFLVELALALDIAVDIITLNRDEKTMTSEELQNRDAVVEMMNGVKSHIVFTEHTDIKQGLIDFCTENDIGLLSILPKSYNYLERLFHESLTLRMAFQSPVPLLILN